MTGAMEDATSPYHGAFEKSAIEFCRSRMLRKKSLEVSAAGVMVRAGARAGPA